MTATQLTECPNEEGYRQPAKSVGGRASATDTGKWTPFPVQLLPEPFSSYVSKTARARQCDSAAVALPLLAALAGTIGTARVIRIWRDWCAPAVLWTGVVAPSGAVKSPAFDAAIAPLEEMERREREAWRLQQESVEGQQGSPVDPMASESIPPRCIVEDTTLQALAKLLPENPRGLLLARDELSGWVRSFDQFTGAGGADLARWLEIYRAGSLRVDRKVDGYLHVSRAAVSICGTIQSEMLPRVFHDEHQSAGLLARFLIALPPAPRRRWDLGKTAALPDREELTRRFSALRAMELPAEGQPPKSLDLAADADSVYGEWFERHVGLLSDTGQGPIAAALSKLEEVPGRLALVLALGRSDTPTSLSQVDEDTMMRAVRLTDWFVAEAQRIYDLMIETPKDRSDRELVEWVQSRPEGATTRDVVRGHGRYRRKGGTEDAQRDLTRLVGEGRLSSRDRQPGPQGGRSTIVFFAVQWCVETGIDGHPVSPPIESRARGDGDETHKHPLGDRGCVTVSRHNEVGKASVSSSGNLGDGTIYEGEI